ncbi:tyrosine-type recombinase/integrase [Methylomicrobium sp. Wu6]|uniref:phage integrase n=1 Tax=Methylomicrobium sp. Wu6 TaxID=3107928 RepID=UPI002DD62957|nr:tyrosine-type recombinase/integrase [Methylomicrobium sp. Wu6]MEC4749804.1 tyrosine-type recombinase/integrase [Methylomicrobium sp. Wu6]
MSIKKVDGKYKLDVRPNGAKGKRVIRLFDSKSQALQYRNQLLSGRLENQADQASFDNLRLNDLIEKWYDLHGRSLKSSLDTKNRLLKLSKILGNPIARTLSPELLADYRKIRIDEGIASATLNRELITLKAMFRELRRLSVIDYDSPLLVVRKLREPKIELSYLSTSDLVKLSKQVDVSKNESLWFVFTICLITGSRWSEANGLTYSNCINSGFQFVDTKNGHSRFVPVDFETFDTVRSRLVHGPFLSCYSAFRSAMKRTGLSIPKGQMAHILRHTFASHFVMGGGNLVALQKILGHSSLNITMRYSHLAPDYLKQAIELNPLSKINRSGKKMERKLSGIKKPVDDESLTG